MKLDGLIPLYRKLKSSERTYGFFKYTKNKVDFDILFDVGKIPFKIGFLVLNNNFQLWIDIKNGFIINPFLNKTDLVELFEILNLKYDPENKFSTKKFFHDFNSKIPNDFRLLKTLELSKLISSTYDIDEPNKMYYNGIIDWDKVNNGNNRQDKNLEKTRLLYQKLYEQIKDKNISVRYSQKRNTKLEERIRN